jgi:hypothetical protein
MPNEIEPDVINLDDFPVSKKAPTKIIKKIYYPVEELQDIKSKKKRKGTVRAYFVPSHIKKTKKGIIEVPGYWVQSYDRSKIKNPVV